MHRLNLISQSERNVHLLRDDRALTKRESETEGEAGVNIDAGHVPSIRKKLLDSKLPVNWNKFEI